MRLLKRIGLVLILASTLCTAFPAQDSAVLLEKAIYTEETLGNLNEAIGLYQQIVADTDAGRATSALALYRLGMCYQKSGRAGDAQAIFSKLTRQYPEQQDLISKIPVLSNAPKFRSAPWEDGEVLQFSILAKGSASGIGFQISEIESVPEASKTGWKIRSISGMTGAMETETVRMDEKYAPVEHQQGGIEQGTMAHSKYFPDHVEISKGMGDAAKTTEYRLNRTVYDGAQAGYLLRALPLREGYETTLPILSSDGTIIDLKISVEGREKITVAAGTFDCFRIITKTNTAERTSWISADSHFYPVKLNASDTINLELKSVSKIEKIKPSRFTDDDQGLSFSLPPGWIGAASKLMGQTLISLMDPEDETSCYLGLSKPSISSTEDIKTLLPKAIDQLVSMYQPQYKGFQVRSDSRQNTALGGLPAVQFIADYKALVSGQDSVMYAFFFASSDKLGQIFLRTKQENFDKWRPVFDSIANSIQMK